MTLRRFETVHGSPYMTRANLAEMLGVSRVTVDARCKEIKEEIRQGRYDERVLIEDGGFKLINVYAYMDYICYRKRLREKNMRKHVPPYDPIAIARQMGYYKTVETEENVV